jgi:hypothetical protein
MAIQNLRQDLYLGLTCKNTYSSNIMCAYFCIGYDKDPETPLVHS